MSFRINEELSFKRLELFLAYMKTTSMAEAAELMDSNPISVHRAIRSLETSLRVALFRRVGRNLIPSEAAHVLAEAAEEVLDRMEAGVNSARGVAGYASDELKIGSLYSLTHSWMPKVIITMAERRPDLRCELKLGRAKNELLPDLRTGKLDVVFAEVDKIGSDMVSLPIFVDSVYFAVTRGSPYESMSEIDLGVCFEEKIATLTEGPFTTARLRADFIEFQPQVVMEVEDIFTLMNLVANGVACALVHGRIREMFKNNVSFVPVAEKFNIPQTVGACFMRSRERDPNLLSLVAALRLLSAEESRRTQPSTPGDDET
ncbi:LysR family transcriptional regulator [Pusillimonas sp. MFBS29]|uniref:LysR family transcriptional regulator n=1 Tax=Pusillimonas sp. MFBS29 TaxID=2886690 RepID=UPI001D127177|nr:LysR family transcriptional regulator [Pusillimonas sp. MFBS29]MCC2595895.1 LysR family transcriptional regulator [Pusillimonas sp. MFBS29]